MSAMGHMRTWRRRIVMPALPLKADIDRQPILHPLSADSGSGRFIRLLLDNTPTCGPVLIRAVISLSRRRRKPRPMVDVAELRNAANTLRRWAGKIRLDSVPAPYATTSEDIGTLEYVAKLLDAAADEIVRLRPPLPK